MYISSRHAYNGAIRGLSGVFANYVGLDFVKPRTNSVDFRDTRKLAKIPSHLREYSSGKSSSYKVLTDGNRVTFGCGAVVLDLVDARNIVSARTKINLRELISLFRVGRSYSNTVFSQKLSKSFFEVSEKLKIKNDESRKGPVKKKI